MYTTRSAPTASKSIRDGADAVMSLIDEETKRRTTHLEEELNQVRAECAKHHEQFGHLKSDLEEQLRVAQEAALVAKDALEKAVADADAAKKDASRAKSELVGAQSSLAQIKVALTKIGVTFDETHGVDGAGESAVVFRSLTGPAPGPPGQGQQGIQSANPGENPNVGHQLLGLGLGNDGGIRTSASQSRGARS